MANSHKHRLTRTLVADGETINSVAQEFTADGVIERNPTVPASATNFLVSLSFTVAKLKSIWISAPGALTLKTNSSGSPQETIALAANIPFVWNANEGAVPFAGNVTALYVTNADTSPVELTIRVLDDATPST